MLNLPNNKRVYLFGSPCKIKNDEQVFYCRYIGDTSSQFDNINNMMILSTPNGSIFTAKYSSIDFELTDDEMDKLHHFEEIAIHVYNTWYHEDVDMSKYEKAVYINPKDIQMFSNTKNKNQ